MEVAADKKPPSSLYAYGYWQQIRSALFLISTSLMLASAKWIQSPDYVLGVLFRTHNCFVTVLYS